MSNYKIHPDVVKLAAKQTFQKGATERLVYPLTGAPDKASIIVSPRAGNDHGVVYPKKEQYAELLAEIIDVRHKVLKDEYPLQFLRQYFPKEWGTLSDDIPEPLKGIPDLWSQMKLKDTYGVDRSLFLSKQRPQGLAAIVHMDAVTDLYNALVSWVMSQPFEGKRFKDDDSQHIDFVSNVVQTNEDFGDRLKRAFNQAFDAKYYGGVPRPEEIFEVVTGANGKMFTHYPEGCPCHAEHPQGHSTDAGSTGRFISDKIHLTSEELTVIRESCYLWGAFRCLSGVHFGPSIAAGLRVGGLL